MQLSGFEKPEQVRAPPQSFVLLLGENRSAHAGECEILEFVAAAAEFPRLTTGEF